MLREKKALMSPRVGRRLGRREGRRGRHGNVLRNVCPPTKSNPYASRLSIGHKLKRHMHVLPKFSCSRYKKK